MLFSKKRPQRNLSRGFSLIELMVTISIVVLVTGAVMLRYSSFNSAVLLNSQAFLLAFDIREAQSLAISVRGRGSEFREEYGMYFTMATPNQYQLFQDNGGGIPKYDAGEEIDAPYIIDPRYTIVDLCATEGTTESCYSDGDGKNNWVSVSFARPDFDAVIRAQGHGGSAVSSAKIILGVSNDSDFKKVIEVTSAGQISVQSF